MNRENNVDHVLDSWFTEGPTNLPDRTVAAIVEGLDDVRQRRALWLPWRLSMPRSASALAGAAIFLVVAVVAMGVYLNRPGVGSEPSRPPSASPTHQSSTFTSALHGIAIDYPSGWLVREANEAYRFGGAPAFEAPNTDVIYDPIFEDQLYFALVSWPLHVTPDNDGCCSALLQATPSCGEADPWWVDYSLDGSDHGFIRECRDEDGARRHTVAVANNGRAYVIVLRVGSEAPQGIYDAVWFRRALDTVHLFQVTG